MNPKLFRSKKLVATLYEEDAIAALDLLHGPRGRGRALRELLDAELRRHGVFIPPVTGGDDDPEGGAPAMAA